MYLATKVCCPNRLVKNIRKILALKADVGTYGAQCVAQEHPPEVQPHHSTSVAQILPARVASVCSASLNELTCSARVPSGECSMNARLHPSSANN